MQREPTHGFPSCSQVGCLEPACRCHPIFLQLSPFFFGFLPGCPPDLARASYVGSSKPRLLDCEMGWMVMVRCKSWRLICPTGSSEVGGKEITSPRLGAFLQDFQGMRLILLIHFTVIFLPYCSGLCSRALAFTSVNIWSRAAGHVEERHQSRGSGGVDVSMGPAVSTMGCIGVGPTVRQCAGQDHCLQQLLDIWQRSCITL